jgi:hypothetical protein
VRAPWIFNPWGLNLDSFGDCAATPTPSVLSLSQLRRRHRHLVGAGGDKGGGMQHCDSTCSWCAREWFRWWRQRAQLNEKRSGRSGPGHFARAQSLSAARFTRAAKHRAQGQLAAAAHARKRARERLGLELSDTDLFDLAAQVADRRSIAIKPSGHHNRVVHLVRVGNRWHKAVYDPDISAIVTFL